MKKILTNLFQHQLLTRSEAEELLIKIAHNEYNDAEIAALISVFQMRSITTDEFIGFSDALLILCRDMSRLSQYDPIDIVGTGGDGKNTFNISTLSCIVTAAAGYKVTKHGNYGASSVSGSSTVMERMGVKFSNDLSVLEKSLDECNLAFLHAPLFNDALKVVAPIRQKLKVRTFFNMLGPIVNPVKNKKSVLGVFNLKMARMYHYYYQKKSLDYAIVHALDGYDEISLTGDFKVITPQGENIYTPQGIGFSRYAEEVLYGGNTAEEAALIFKNVIENKAQKAQKDVVLVNTAFAIRTICKEKTLAACVEEAREAIDSGAAKQTFEKFLAINK